MSGGGGGGGSGVAGHRYYMGVHMGLCRGPVDEIVEIRIGDRTVTIREAPPTTSNDQIGTDENGNPIYVTNTTNSPIVTGGLPDSGQFYIDSPDLFGGEDKEGGVVGSLDVLMGEPTQMPLPAIEAMVGRSTPAWRQIVSLFFDGIVAMVNPYPKAWKVRVRRTSKGWFNDSPFDSTRVQINLTGPADPNYPNSPVQIAAMNPAAIIYECLTNPEWGRGLPASRIDTASFVAASTALFAEGFGLCLKWDRTSPIEQFIQQIIDTIAATIYQDRSTGKLVLKLIRADYTFASLPLFDSSSGLVEIQSAGFGAPSDQINEVIVKWRDPVTGEDRSTRAQNLAAIQSAGATINSTSREFLGIPTVNLANRVAQRELRLASFPLRKFTVTLDRRGWQVYPGSVFRIRDVVRNIPDMAVRVATVSEGGLVNGKITVECVQDIFSMPSTAITAAQGSLWTPPATDPCLGRTQVIEIPYFLLAQGMTPAEFSALTPQSARLGVLVAEGQGLNTGYNILVRDGAPTAEDASAGSAYYCGYIP
nr:MAG TPA: tail protein [Caudoviricetes sp.]